MSTINYTVTVVSAKFLIDGAVAPKLTFRDGDTYVLDQADSSNAGHILQFSITSNNSGSAEYDTGVTKTGTAGQAGAKTTIVTSGSTTDTLYYYSSGGGTYGEEFSNSGFNTSTTYNLLKPIVGAESTAEKWGPMINHALDQIDQGIDAAITAQNLDFQGDSGGALEIDLDTETLDIAGGTGIDTTGSGNEVSVAIDATVATLTGSQTLTGKSIVASQLTGTIADARMPNLTGDITTVEGAVATTIAASVIGVKPHIIPDVLYPSSGDDLAGDALVATTDGPNSSTVASSKYGTVQASDGRMYYYTDIKGSKPIKDPRIGSHFGSQRHTFSSIQLLEQETATDGNNVYSVDGREWIRIVDGGTTGVWNLTNDLHGIKLEVNTDATGAILEITGYFNDFNVAVDTDSNRADAIKLTVNGTISEAANALVGGRSTVPSPLGSRYVSRGSLINGGSTLSASLGTTPSINTLKYEITSGANEYLRMYNIELIAQDTSNVNKIQIPSQNVVSYGKKFTVSGTPHYNPFAQNQAGTAVAIADGAAHGSVATGWSGTGSGSYDDTLDEATSLGLSAWEIGANYYRPVNGGRVVKWVDSSGNIKTSVNMMPPAAKAIGSHSGSNLPNATSWTSVYLPVIQSGTPDHSQAEVAKTFDWREFGNGNANGGAHTGSENPPYADASMLTNSLDNIAYVMDDGLTSLSGQSLRYYDDGLMFNNVGDFLYITFIGTGFTLKRHCNATDSSDEYDKYIDGIKVVDGAGSWADNVFTTETLAQNLPYGTHIVKLEATAVATVNETYDEFTFHQPKMPPIPEDAVVLADYMLMADFVAVGSSGLEVVSKGCRKLSLTRDCFIDSSSALGAGVSLSITFSFGLRPAEAGSAEMTQKLPAFATECTWQGETNATSLTSAKNSWGGNAITLAQQSGGTGTSEILTYSSGTKPELGMNVLQHLTSASGHSMNAMEVASPIHTSSHYQTFETPFLHELVGGDRNMEQTNLVVTPDGKTWDEVTRDVSYIGDMALQTNTDTDYDSGSDVVIFDEWRGTMSGINSPNFNKHFAIAYDRLVCLTDGQYRFNLQSLGTAGNDCGGIYINGTLAIKSYVNSNDDPFTSIGEYNLIRGDYIQVKGVWYQSNEYNTFNVTRL